MLHSLLVSALLAAVFTTQVGFTPSDPKLGVLTVPTGATVQKTFRVLDAATTAAVYTSQTADVQFYPAGWSGNNTTGDTYLLDFTRAELSGGHRYMLESNGERSFPFTIAADVYDVRRFRSLEFFRIQRSGVNVRWESLDGTVGGHGPDHLDDARQATPDDKGGNHEALIEQDPLPLPNGHLDVAGGWFDAGDYNTYMGNTPWAAYLLMLTWEDYRSYWSKVDNNHNGEPDILEYARPALDWMLKMCRSDGSVYERVFNGFTARFDGRPDMETDNKPGNADDRPLDTDRYADITAKSSFAMAAAYRAFHDPRYLDMAVKTWDWAYANQDRTKPKVYGGGLYFGDIEIGLTLGALELHRAQRAAGKVPNPKYLEYAQTHVRKHLVAEDWANPSSWPYQQSYVLIRYYDLASRDDQSRIVAQLKARADHGIQTQTRNPYRMDDTWLYSGFGQNDMSASSADDALWVFEKTKDQKYYDYAVNQMAWVFGRNPFGESWLASSTVSEYPHIPHWRVTAKHPIEGVVTPGAADHDHNHIPDYTDTGEWFYSEPSINQQAMFIRSMTALYFASCSVPVPKR
jgi:endoglucanase